MSVQLQSRWYKTLSVGGRNIGPFQGFTGGDVTGDSATSRPPGAEFPRQPGGEKEIAPITLTRDYDISVDTDEQMAFLRSQVGVEDVAIVARKPFDRNRNPFGRGRTWVGVITAVSEPESDTNTQNDKSVLSITIQPSTVS